MNAEDVFKYGHLTVVETVEGLPESVWETPNVCGVWSVKEIIAHLASFEHLLVDGLNLLLGGEAIPTMDRFARVGDQKFNDLEVADRQNKTVAEVWTEYEETYARTAAMLAQIPVEKRRRSGSVPWYGEEYDLEDVLVYTFYGHKREHCAQINVFRDKLDK